MENELKSKEEVVSYLDKEVCTQQNGKDQQDQRLLEINRVGENQERVSEMSTLIAHANV